jgi:hypothetical protein
MESGLFCAISVVAAASSVTECRIRTHVSCENRSDPFHRYAVTSRPAPAVANDSASSARATVNAAIDNTTSRTATSKCPPIARCFAMSRSHALAT